MSDSGSLICWNCSQRTTAGTCVHCGAELSNPDDAFKEDKVETKARMLEIPRQNAPNIQINLDDVIELVRNDFTVKRMVLSSELHFVVEDPQQHLGQQFDHLLAQSEALVKGFKPKVSQYKDTNDLLIQYIYTEPRDENEYRTVLLLAIFSLVSVFMAGMFNYTQLQDAKGILNQPGVSIFGVFINVPAILSSLIFTAIIGGIIILKDSIQLVAILRGKKNTITPFYIPAPPIFELGTLGSITRQDHIHKTKNEMFNAAFYGPFISWIVSIFIILFSLPLAEFNRDAAHAYANHSIVANGKYEPIILTALGHLSNLIGLTHLDLSSPLTQSYIFSPITLAGLAGFYLSAFAFLPAAHFNGGYIIRSTLGKRAHTIMTYLSVIAVFSIYWLLSFLLYLVYELLKTPQILNDKTEVKPINKVLLIPYFIIFLISFPLDLQRFSFLFNLFY